MLRHGTCACRSAGCECADCRATESIDRMEAREAERSWFGLVKVNRERLQGFPDDWTLIPYRGKPAGECPDTPRYKALGNSMAVPVMRWIGERMALSERGIE